MLRCVFCDDLLEHAISGLCDDICERCLRVASYPANVIVLPKSECKLESEPPLMASAVIRAEVAA